MESKKLEIIFAHPIDPYFSREGGGVRYISDVANYMSARGAHVTLAGTALQRPMSRHSKSVKFVHVNKLLNRAWQLYPIELLLGMPFLHLPKGAIIHTIRVDFMMPFVFYFVKSPKVITLGGRQLLVFSIGHPLLHNLFGSVLGSFIRLVLSRVDAVITDERTLGYYRQIYSEIDKKAVVLPTSSVHMDVFKPMEKRSVREQYGFDVSEKVVVFVGRIDREKNVDFLIRSFAIVAKKTAKSRLLIVGTGSDPKYWSNLQKLVADSGLAAVVNFLGERDHEEIPSILNLADVLALCSVCEGSPTVVREALACGVPVVSTNVGDVAQLLDNSVVGSIVEFDEEKYALEIIRFFNLNQEGAQETRRRALIEKQMDFDSVASKILETYKKIRYSRSETKI